MSRFFFSLFLFPLVLVAAYRNETICLNMIVKNESHVIEHCLDSVKEQIDYWVIVDTGSTDGTQEIIREYLKDIPGELHERPWKNFDHNRNEALELAKDACDFILLMDADDFLEYSPGFELPPLNADRYYVWAGSSAYSYIRPLLVKSDLPWKWVGVRHEYLTCDAPFTSSTLENVKCIYGSNGSRSQDPEKYQKDAKILEEALKEDPNNARNAFYLAQSYFNAGEKGKALEWYQHRIQMGGWNQEVYWSKLRIALIVQEMGLPSDMIISSYMDAHYYRPHRAEAIYYLAKYYNKIGKPKKAYALIKGQSLIPQPYEKDTLFNEDWIRDYGLLLELSISAYYAGKYQESLDACDRLLTNKNIPESWRKLTESNRSFPLEKIQSINN